MVKLVTLAFNTNHMKEMVAFYEAIGAILQPKQVRNGSLSYQGHLGQVNLTLYDIAKGESSASPNFSMKIEVDNLNQVMSNLAKLDKVEAVMDQESLPDGKMSIVIDPEGHSIELSEPWKEA